MTAFTYTSSPNIFSRYLTLFMICQPFRLQFVYDSSMYFISQEHLTFHCLVHLQTLLYTPTLFSASSPSQTGKNLSNFHSPPESHLLLGAFFNPVLTCSLQFNLPLFSVLLQHLTYITSDELCAFILIPNNLFKIEQH